MRILHIAKIKGNKALGVDVVVPQHVQSQSKFAEVGFVNLNGIKITDLDKYQLICDDNRNIPNNLSDGFNRPDLVVFHEVNNIENINIYRNLLRFNIPYVIIPHGELTQTALMKKYIKKKIAYILLFNSFINHSIGLQCLSQQELEDIKFKKFKFVGTNGIFDNPNKKVNYKKGKGFNLLYLGRLEMNIKGIDRMLDALSSIQIFCEENEITLKIFGPDVAGRKKALEDYIESKNLQKIVKIYAPIFDEKKYNEMRASDAFIQTSRSEGMPVGILEAMNMGLPCILTKGTRLVDISKKYEACYYAGETKDEIASTIKMVCDDNINWTKIANNAIIMTQKEFEWDVVSKNTINKYKELLKIND